LASPGTDHLKRYLAQDTDWVSRMSFRKTWPER
jgi:hypothetical protein